MTEDTAPRKVLFEGVTRQNIVRLRDLNMALFPIKYQVRCPPLLCHTVSGVCVFTQGT